MRSFDTIPSIDASFLPKTVRQSEEGGHIYDKHLLYNDTGLFTSTSGSNHNHQNRWHLLAYFDDHRMDGWMDESLKSLRLRPTTTISASKKSIFTTVEYFLLFSAFTCLSKF